MSKDKTINNYGYKDTGGWFYQVPGDIMDILFETIGDNPPQLRIMLVLIGTKPGYKASFEYMLNRTKLTKPTYYRGLKALCDKGYIAISKDQIIVMYDVIRGDTSLDTWFNNKDSEGSNTSEENSNEDEEEVITNNDEPVTEEVTPCKHPEENIISFLRDDSVEKKFNFTF